MMCVVYWTGSSSVAFHTVLNVILTFTSLRLVLHCHATIDIVMFVLVILAAAYCTAVIIAF